MLADFFAKALEEAQDPWRRVVAKAAELGIPTPAFSSSLAYYDGYRRARGPAGLIQGCATCSGLTPTNAPTEMARSMSCGARTGVRSSPDGATGPRLRAPQPALAQSQSVETSREYL